jgi:hypothetical protein
MAKVQLKKLSTKSLKNGLRFLKLMANYNQLLNVGGS